MARLDPKSLHTPRKVCSWIPPKRFKKALDRKRDWLRLLRDVYMRIGMTKRGRRLNAKLRVLKRVNDLAELYMFYTTHSPRFATDNTQALFRSLNAADRERFPFDAGQIDWHEYIMTRHIPGLHRMNRPSLSAGAPGSHAAAGFAALIVGGDDERREISA